GGGDRPGRARRARRRRAGADRGRREPGAGARPVRRRHRVLARPRPAAADRRGARARAARRVLPRSRLDAGRRRSRADAGGAGGNVVVVASTSDDRSEALGTLRSELVFAGLLGLALATLGGYLLAGPALRPLRDLGRRASTITRATSGERLPVPPSGDELAA